MEIPKTCLCCLRPHNEDGSYCPECHDCSGTCDPVSPALQALSDSIESVASSTQAQIDRERMEAEMRTRTRQQGAHQPPEGLFEQERSLL